MVITGHHRYACVCVSVPCSSLSAGEQQLQQAHDRVAALQASKQASKHIHIHETASIRLRALSAVHSACPRSYRPKHRVACIHRRPSIGGLSGPAYVWIHFTPRHKGHRCRAQHDTYTQLAYTLRAYCITLAYTPVCWLCRLHFVHTRQELRVCPRQQHKQQTMQVACCRS